ncbi:MAG: glycosyltransferase [Selenomonas ruminantium]|nr:glycosyltransferase [Selenomonas ruminantium]
MNIVISSMHFSPAFISHMGGYGNLCRMIGADVSFLIDEKYKEFGEFNRQKIYTDIPKNEISKYDLIIFVNFAVENVRIARLWRKQGKKIIYVLHEPDLGMRRLYHESFVGAAKIIIAGIISKYICRLSDLVLVASQQGMNSYKKYYSMYNSNVRLIPLIFDDEIRSEDIRIGKKIFFSYIGNISKSHAFLEYIKAIKKIHEINGKAKFLIATRNDINNLINNDKYVKNMIEDETLIIQSGRDLSNEEINHYYLDSFCVWTAYASSTQSGVLGKSFMAGTPVLASRVGSFNEFVIEGKNGEIINSYSFEVINEKIMQIFNNKREYVKNARDTYEKIYSYKSYEKTFAKIVDELNG